MKKLSEFLKNKKSIVDNAEIVEYRLPSQAYIIAEIIRGCKYKDYLELGIYHGTTYNYIKQYVKNAYAVDMEKKDFIEEKYFSCMTTDDFFKNNKKNLMLFLLMLVMNTNR